MRLVLDTNVVASAFLWGGKPGSLLRAIREGRHTAFSSTPLLAELNVVGRYQQARLVSVAEAERLLA